MGIDVSRTTTGTGGYDTPLEMGHAGFDASDAVVEPSSPRGSVAVGVSNPATSDGAQPGTTQLTIIHGGEEVVFKDPQLIADIQAAAAREDWSAVAVLVGGALQARASNPLLWTLDTVFNFIFSGGQSTTGEFSLSGFAPPAGYAEGDHRGTDYGGGLYSLIADVNGQSFDLLLKFESPTEAESADDGNGAVESEVGRRLFEDIDVDGNASIEQSTRRTSHFDLAAERTFNLAARILEATDGTPPSDWTDVEYTALAFVLSGHADLVARANWSDFVAANFDNGRFVGGGHADLSMFKGLSEEDTITLNLATIEATITHGTMGELPTGLSEFDADTWETAFRAFLAPEADGGRRLNVWDEEFGEFWEQFVDEAIPGSSEAFAEGQLAYAYEIPATVVTGAGEVALGTALASAGLVVGAELLIAYVAVQAFRKIQHEYKIPVYGAQPTAALQERLSAKLTIAEAAVPTTDSPDQGWVQMQVMAVQNLTAQGRTGEAVELLRSIEAEYGAHAVAVVFTQLNPDVANTLSNIIFDELRTAGGLHPSNQYLQTAAQSGNYSAVDDLALQVLPFGYSIGESLARTDGAISAIDIGRINANGGSETIADILTVLAVQEVDAPGTSNIETFIGLTLDHLNDGSNILNDAVKILAGRRDGSAERLMQVLIARDDPRMPIDQIFAGANTEVTAEYYEATFGSEGAGIVPEAPSGLSVAFNGLKTPQERGAFLNGLVGEQATVTRLNLLQGLTPDEARAVLVYMTPDALNSIRPYADALNFLTAANPANVTEGWSAERFSNMLTMIINDNGSLGNAAISDAAEQLITLSSTDPQIVGEALSAVGETDIAGTSQLLDVMIRTGDPENVAKVLVHLDTPIANELLGRALSIEIASTPSWQPSESRILDVIDGMFQAGLDEGLVEKGAAITLGSVTTMLPVETRITVLGAVAGNDDPATLRAALENGSVPVFEGMEEWAQNETLDYLSGILLGAEYKDEFLSLASEQEQAEFLSKLEVPTGNYLGINDDMAVEGLTSYLLAQPPSSLNEVESTGQSTGDGYVRFKITADDSEFTVELVMTEDTPREIRLRVFSAAYTMSALAKVDVPDVPNTIFDGETVDDLFVHFQYNDPKFPKNAAGATSSLTEVDSATGRSSHFRIRTGSSLSTMTGSEVDNLLYHEFLHALGIGVKSSDGEFTWEKLTRPVVNNPKFSEYYGIEGRKAYQRLYGLKSTPDFIYIFNDGGGHTPPEVFSLMGQYPYGSTTVENFEPLEVAFLKDLGYAPPNIPYSALYTFDPRRQPGLSSDQKTTWRPENALTSRNGKYTAVVSDTGVISVYQTDQNSQVSNAPPILTYGQAGQPGTSVAFTSDGQLIATSLGVLYGTSETWKTEPPKTKHGAGGYVLVVTDDGDLQIRRYVIGTKQKPDNKIGGGVWSLRRQVGQSAPSSKDDP